MSGKTRDYSDGLTICLTACEAAIFDCVRQPENGTKDENCAMTFRKCAQACCDSIEFEL